MARDREPAATHGHRPAARGLATAPPALSIERGRRRGELRATGQLDRSNAHLLAEAVRLVGRGIGPTETVRLDCSGLAFLDATGPRALARAAADLGSARQLVLREPGPLVSVMFAALPRRDRARVAIEPSGVRLRRAS